MEKIGIYKGKGTLLGIPYQKRREPLCGACNKTQIEAIENLFFAILHKLRLADKRVVFKEGEYSYVPEDNSVVLEELVLFAFPKLLAGKMLKWENIKNDRDNYLYITPSSRSMCLRNEFTLSVDGSYLGKSDVRELLVVVNFDENGELVVCKDREGVIERDTD